jgi:chemotaxis signal transduction protein
VNVHERTTSDRYCIFRAAGAPFAVSALSVCEIAERPSMVAVPDSPAALAGLCHFRNEFVPVLNLRHFVGTSHAAAAEGGFLLVLTGREGRWAFVIERGLALEPLEIAYASAGGAQEALIGTASYREEVVQVLDADILYDQAAALLEHNWQHTGQRTEVRDQRSEVRHRERIS